MLIAFYAPMKPLDDPVPSGDRQMGRLIVRALEEAGHRVRIVSRLRSWSMSGGREQHALRRAAETEAQTLIDALAAEAPAPDLWITYHLYHKAPDWIGPAVCDALGLAYVVIEASRAAKQRHGPWALGFAAADAALDRANAVAALHQEDAEGLADHVAPARLFRLTPFIDSRLFRTQEAAARRAPAPATASRMAQDPGAPPGRLPDPAPAAGLRLVTVAMMRRGDKERSYRVLAEALDRLGELDWSLVIAGDGEARADLMPLFPPDRTTWLGAVANERLNEVYAMGEIFAWPAVNEAFGLVLLEAQAAGLAVVAGRSGGVPEMVREGVTGYLCEEGDAAAFAAALKRFADRPEDIARFGKAARARIARHHTLASGRAGLERIIEAALDDHRRRAVN